MIRASLWCWKTSPLEPTPFGPLPPAPGTKSFKNDGAYAQVTFHVFAKTQENSPDPKLPLLTYSRPQGAYGAEPILLDFYLTNAPLHLVAQENDKDDIADWRIRATVNGESFVIDRWQPLYLKGFKPGKNWVQLEFLDEKGQLSFKHVQQHGTANHLRSQRQGHAGKAGARRTDRRASPWHRRSELRARGTDRASRTQAQPYADRASRTQAQPDSQV